MGRKRKAVLSLLLLAALFVGCAAVPSLERADEIGMPWDDAAPAPPAESWLAEDAAIMQPEEAAPDLPPMIIYVGELSLVVRDTELAHSEAVALAEAAGGHVASARSFTVGAGLRRVTLTLRVPADAFTPTMAALRAMAMEITQDEVTSEDVTQEYVDLESRLRALEVKAERLEELMEQAEDTEAVLAVYSELSRTQVQIEETKGRMRYLERRAAMSTITVLLTPDELSRPVEIAGWRPIGTARRAIETVVVVFQFLIDALIWFFLVVVPVLLFFGVGIYALIRILGLIFGWGKRKKSAGTEEGATGS